MDLLRLNEELQYTTFVIKSVQMLELVYMKQS